MKKLALVMCLLLVASCSGGGGDSNYNFNGRWLIQSEVAAAQCTWTVASGEMLIQQDRSDIVLQFPPGSTARRGTCNPKAKTFTVTYAQDNGTVVTWNGMGETKDVMSGTRRAVATNGCWADIVWTADLISR